MNLQQLETSQLIEAEDNFSRESLKVISKLNPCLAEDEILLLSYYKQVKSTWSSSAIKNLKDAEGLKLTNKLNRCKFAIAAAKLQLQFLSNGDESQVTISAWKGKRGQKADGRGQMLSYSESYSENNLIFPDSNSLSRNKTLKNKEMEEMGEEKPSAFCPARGLPSKPLNGGVPELNSSKPPRAPSAFDTFQADLLESEALQIAQEQIQLLESQLQEKEEQLQQQEEQLKQSENFSFLLLTHRLLTPGLPLNGTENTPAMRVLGSPKTLTELHCNYRELIKREHPDVSPFPQTIAIERFGYLRSLYRITRENWEILKPTAVISKEQLEARMNAPVPFCPDSFWL